MTPWHGQAYAWCVRRRVKVSEIRRLAMLHCTEKEAAGYLRVSLKAFQSMLRFDTAARSAWDEGQAKGKISIRRKQFRLADTSAPMAIFLGKQYLGQSDVIVTEHSGRDGGPIQTYDVSKLNYDECKQLRDLLARSYDGQSAPDDAGAGQEAKRTKT